MERRPSSHTWPGWRGALAACTPRQNPRAALGAVPPLTVSLLLFPGLARWVESTSFPLQQRLLQSPEPISTRRPEPSCLSLGSGRWADAELLLGCRICARNPPWKVGWGCQGRKPAGPHQAFGGLKSPRRPPVIHLGMHSFIPQSFKAAVATQWSMDHWGSVRSERVATAALRAWYVPTLGIQSEPKTEATCPFRVCILDGRDTD